VEVLPFFVIVMNKDEILAEKIRTFITRNRARDIYDLWFLLQRGAGLDVVYKDVKEMLRGFFMNHVFGSLARIDLMKKA